MASLLRGILIHRNQLIFHLSRVCEQNAADLQIRIRGQINDSLNE